MLGGGRNKAVWFRMARDEGSGSGSGSGGGALTRATVNRRDAQGMTALMHFAQRGELAAAKRAVEELGADVRAADDTG
jgi:hypothetical protein